MYAMETTMQPRTPGSVSKQKKGIHVFENFKNGLPLTPPPDDLFPCLMEDHLASCSPLSSRQTTPLQRAQRPTVAVIGTGYVGLHLVEAFSTAYDIIAFDVNPSRVKEVEEIVKGKQVECTSDPRLLTRATHFLIAVSTLLTPSRSIDTTYIQSAIATIEKYAPGGATVVVESSVAVGMTRDLLTPLMNTRSFKCGMSPERVDPGRVYPHYTTIPKLVSGLDQASLESIQTLYSRIFTDVVPVSSPEVAEMTKLYENCQRMMCIAYANEMADACAELSESLSSKLLKDRCSGSPQVHIDPWEVARAAATKPFGYMPYTPSLGVGGHCIPVNPYYLSSNAAFPLLTACTERMNDRPARIGDQIMRRLDLESKEESLRNPSNRQKGILIVGLGFKSGQSVLSNSPGKAVATHLLSSYNVYVEFADPLVCASAVSAIPRLNEKQDWNVEYLVKKFDAVIVAVNQPGLDMEVLRDAEKQGVLIQSFVKFA